MAPTVYLPAIDNQAWLSSTYHYEHMNRLTKIKTDSNANDVAEFRYDGLGRRIQKKDLVDPNNTRWYYYNHNWQVLTEYDGSNNLQRKFIYGPGIDEPVCMIMPFATRVK